MSEPSEYSLWAPVHRQSEACASRVIFVRIKRMDAKRWKVTLAVPRFEERPNETPTHETVLPAIDHLEAITQAIVWFLPITAEALECPQGEVVLGHSEWQQES